MVDENEIQTYSDAKPEYKEAFEGIERIELSEVLNKEIVIKEFVGLPSTLSEGKEFSVIKAEIDGVDRSFSCGEVVLKQLREVEEKLPIKATISKAKGKRYYTLN